ncbi:unnamed protein product [Colletotrichum noveboracense]|uniref:Sulfite efflux pump SSU1 n=1 Tax=Colletotrichum noveboracense TaxID=2664923 RepID=A0A9W4WPL8_9PEZI|nr:unnamed protein product [Colletotrichum noveboracense]
MATISTTATIQSKPQQACPKSETDGTTAGDTTPCTPCKEDVGWRKIVRNFTPSWFAVTMGTGIVSILLHSLPYNATWISHGLALAFFVLNVGLFTIFTGITVLRYALYPEIWKAMVIHPAQSMFLGCFPMGFATIINMMIFVCAPAWGKWVVSWAWGFWWLDAALSLATCITVPFVMIHQHRPGLQAVTAASLLPIVPVVVASSTGGIVAEALSNPDHAFITLIASYILWGLPPKEAIVSVFLPIGPLGQGGFGIQQLGKVSLKLLPQSTAFTTAAPGAVHGGEILYFLGIFLAFIMWGFALVCLSFALISIVTMQKFPFNMGWWGFTFPLGVMATCTGMLAQDLDSTFFRVMTMIFSLSVCLLWLLVAVRTLHQAMPGEIFFAPCLKDLRDKQAQAGSDRRV